MGTRFSPLRAFFATADEVLAADRERLTEALLQHLKTYEGGGTVHQPVGGYNRDYYIALMEGQPRYLGPLPTQPEYGDRQPEVSRRMQEAWNWAVMKGYLMHNPEQPNPFFVITSDGDELLSRLSGVEQQETYGVEEDPDSERARESDVRAGSQDSDRLGTDGPLRSDLTKAEPIPEVRTQLPTADRWSRGEKIAVWTLVATVVGVIAAWLSIPSWHNSPVADNAPSVPVQEKISQQTPSSVELRPTRPDELSVAYVCEFRGTGIEKKPWKKIDRCQIPTPEFLDKQYQQGDFQCCDGGGVSTATSFDVPRGLEVLTSGMGTWAVSDLKFDTSTFSVQTSCVAEYSFAPCRVSVSVKAHYRNRPETLMR